MKNDESNKTLLIFFPKIADERQVGSLSIEHNSAITLVTPTPNSFSATHV